MNFIVLVDDLSGRTMKMKNILFLILTVFFVFSCKNNTEYKDYQVSFIESDTTTHKIPKGQEFTFGYLTVPENRSNPAGNTISLPVYIFKSRSENPKPDPILYTVGGPGNSSMSASQYMNYYKYLDDRDFILFEQRGTQYARPNLDCPEWSKAIQMSNLPNFNKSQSDSLFNAAARQCKKRLENKGIDLNGYNTNEIAADIEDLRKVLNIEQYNLLTISYSTKIAQVLIRDYPKTIRSAVMDSPLPLEVNYDEVSIKNLLDAVDKLLNDCAQDSECNKAFPNLKIRFHEYLMDRTENPLIVSVDNPINGNEETFYLTGKDLVTIFTSASTGGLPFVPLEINKLLNDDLSSIKEQLASLFEEPGKGNGQGMRLSVWCAEEFPFASQTKIEEETDKYPELKGLSPTVFKSEVCHIWNVKEAADKENKPVNSNIPVLFISGEYDNETPPYFAKMMTENFTNSHHMIFKGWSHTPTTNWGNPCAMESANEFFNNPTNKPLPDCFSKFTMPKFKVE